ncbi:hypothetical protein PR048_031963 [Dryococelus australis]|uniref:DDE Tnp4 domain-containing protein n=1 Tax=Dryococelus australis TaxID=614101 RepID=A0ABQ9GAR8_9NEOP|nr:hypothetical protein PR048_031963 [Dryococelus australis]
MMKPYSHKTSTTDERKRIFSYRLCRTRRTSENAFCILGQGFRIFYQPIAIDMATVDYLIMCCYILHNLEREDYYCAQGTQDTQDKGFQHPLENLIPLIATHARHPANVGERVRKHFTEYFCIEGSVPWQAPAIQESEQISGIITSTSHDTYTRNGKYRQMMATSTDRRATDSPVDHQSLPEVPERPFHTGFYRRAIVLNFSELLLTLASHAL